MAASLSIVKNLYAATYFFGLCRLYLRGEFAPKNTLQKAVYDRPRVTLYDIVLMTYICNSNKSPDWRIFALEQPVTSLKMGKIILGGIRDQGPAPWPKIEGD